MEEERQEKYCFVFEYAHGACIGISADTLCEARAVFIKMIEENNSGAVRTRRRRGKPVEEVVKHWDFDPYLIEPKVY